MMRGSCQGNVLSARAQNEKIPFISEDDLEIYQKYRDAAFEVQVGLHELTGTSMFPAIQLKNDQLMLFQAMAVGSCYRKRRLESSTSTRRILPRAP